MRFRRMGKDSPPPLVVVVKRISYVFDESFAMDENDRQRGVKLGRRMYGRILGESFCN